MADRKVSELNAATLANLHEDALFHAVDLTEALAANQNVKASLSQVRQALVTSGYMLMRTEVFTANGTFTKANYPYMRGLNIKLIGGGGGGGGAYATAAGEVSVGGGGGSGGLASRWMFSFTNLAANVNVIIGSGGAGGTAGAAGLQGGQTIFEYASGSPAMTAYGGLGGQSVAAQVPPIMVRGGRPGYPEDYGANTRYSSKLGEPGGIGMVLSTAMGMGGVGGGVIDEFGGFGPNGAGGFDVSGSGVAASLGYGVGGSGAMNFPSESARNGGDGAGGVAIFEIWG